MRWSVIFGLLLLALPARAEDARKVIHDGVEMTMTKSGDGLEIAYGIDVPATLRELGVTTGTMLVRGKWEDKILVGDAWAFSPDCKSVEYPVFGVVDAAGALVVFGPVPRTCKAGGDYSWGKAAVMRFEQPASVERQVERVKPKPKSKPKVARPKPRAVAPRPSQPSYSFPSFYQQPQWRW